MGKVVGMREWRFKPFSKVCVGLYWFGVKTVGNVVFGPNRACSMPIGAIARHGHTIPTFHPEQLRCWVTNCKVGKPSQRECDYCVTNCNLGIRLLGNGCPGLQIVTQESPFA